MKKLNQAVETVQMKGVANSEQEFTFIFNTLKNRVEREIHRYMDKKFPRVPFDRDSVITYCLYEWLERIINSFDPTKGDFIPFYFSTLNRGILNALQPQMTKKNKVNTEVITLNLEIDDDGTTLLDVIPAEEPQEEFSDSMIEAIEKFGKLKGEKAKKVLLALAYYEGRKRTEVICEIYGVKEYDATIRQRVSRIKKDFTKLIQK